ncbi:metallophosphoesterase [Clostridium sp. FS41]|uniref:metallophosphoesterase family protein n=1 Tax=Clostridia TaxID=186801 RepID=UPI0005D3860F|nr:metallophosphoesterase [Clostridium sp. FS41]KJJ77501.1 nuclease SbcCD subunit D [Clostridium sp. FS41]
MKFIHTGDIHWGMCPDANKPWGKERALAIKDTFRTIIENAKEMDVDCLFISGDLFHRQPLMKDLKEVNYLFSTAPSVKIIIIAGNHDRIRDNSALLSFTWSPNVTFLMDENLTSAYFEDINTEVHGFSYHRAEIKEPLLDDIQVPLNSRIQILMAHGGDPAHLPISFNSLELSPFSYIALGHIHKPHIVVEGKMAYCGSPEPLDLTETGPHGYYMGEIHPVTRKLLSLKFVPASSLQYVPLAVNVSKDTTNGELSDRIAREIQNRGEQNIYRFRLKGMRDPEIEFDLEQLSSRFRIAEIIDDSEPQYDFSALFAEHSSDMIGFYIQALQKDDMSPVEKKALYYGVNALLRTTDERS